MKQTDRQVPAVIQVALWLWSRGYSSGGGGVGGSFPIPPLPKRNWQFESRPLYVVKHSPSIDQKHGERRLLYGKIMEYMQI